jgi:glycosyltransferase involved in cell wall biosynthesis
MAAPRCIVSQIIVVDCGSTDQTKTLVLNHAQVIFLESKVQSRAAQMNMGARAATGDLLYFVHADTIPPNLFWVHILEATAQGVQLGCFRYRFRSTSLMLRINAWFTQFRWLWCQGGDKTLFIKKEDFDRLGGYDEYYTIMEEYDLLRRALPGIKYQVLPHYASVSARKYDHNSWLRVQLANARVFQMFRNGARPEDMKITYKNALRSPK